MTTRSTDAPILPLPHANQWIALAGFLVACYVVAAFGSLFTIHSIPTWYAALRKPPFNPPSWLFGPVRALLYGLMAVAAWLIWRKPTSAARLDSLALFTGQLLLNLFWTPVFFYFHRLGLALVIILLLWCAIVLTALSFGRVNRLAATLFLPYLAWVAFASVLNFEIFRLN